MKIGDGSVSPLPALPREEVRVEDGADALVDHFGLHRVVALELAARAVAAVVLLEGARVLAAILQRLAERERELGARLVGESRRLELALHRLDIRVVEAERLQVREAPPGLAEIRAEFNRAAIGVDCLGLAADRLQRVSKTEACRRRLCVELERAAKRLDGFGVMTRA